MVLQPSAVAVIPQLLWDKAAAGQFTHSHFFCQQIIVSSRLASPE
jgi:hypothetical protein